MLTTIFNDGQTIYPVDPSLHGYALWRDYSNRVLHICETVRSRHRDRKALGNAGKPLMSSPGQFQGLDRIVKVCHDTETALVEANVTMESLVDALRPLHLIPTVVSDSRSMTVADAFASTTNSSSSSRFGTFDCTVMAAGMVLGNGEFAMPRIDDEDNGDLLQKSAGALHSLGITSMLEISLMKAGPFVEVTYTPVFSILDMLGETISAASKCAQLDPPLHFVESILIGQYSGMIITGREVLTASRAGLQALDKSDDFTQHVRAIWRRIRHSKKSHVELLPIQDYLFQHNGRRSVLPVPSKRRSWPAVKSPADTATAGPPKFLDFAVSISAAHEVIESLVASYNTWPIWVCPVMPHKWFGRCKTFGLQPAADKLLLNISIWGVACAFDGSLDVFLSQRDSFRYLHSRAPCPPEMVWFDHDDRQYARVRHKWEADTFADVQERLEKVNPLDCIKVSQGLPFMYRRHTTS
jgi:delta24-sterol reductase